MDYEYKLKRALDHADKVKLKQELREIWHANDKEKLSFSKMAFIFMMANCTIVEVYALIVMAVYSDLSALTTLIVAVVGECISLLAYMIKSTHENTSGGIVYESAMEKLRNELGTNNTDDAVG